MKVIVDTSMLGQANMLTLLMLPENPEDQAIIDRIKSDFNFAVPYQDGLRIEIRGSAAESSI